MADTEQAALDRTTLTAQIVSAYVQKNAVSPAELTQMITSVHGALRDLDTVAPEPEKPVPPVPVKKSITPEHLISLEDGRPYKSLKRHLSGRGLTPEQYRSKWGLASDYPMVAPNYAKQRSELAKARGLGRRPAAPPPPPAKGRGGRKAKTA